jgi:hypothetical protein
MGRIVTAPSMVRESGGACRVVILGTSCRSPDVLCSPLPRRHRGGHQSFTLIEAGGFRNRLDGAVD